MPEVTWTNLKSFLSRAVEGLSQVWFGSTRQLRPYPGALLHSVCCRSEAYPIAYR